MTYQFYVKFATVILFISCNLSPGLSVIFCIATRGHFDVALVFHPFKDVWVWKLVRTFGNWWRWKKTNQQVCILCSLPWDQHTSIGYVYEIIFDNYAALYFLFTSGLELLIFISVCVHDQAFYKMFKFLMHELDRLDKKSDQKQLIISLIRLHISGKEYF